MQIGDAVASHDSVGKIRGVEVKDGIVGGKSITMTRTTSSTRSSIKSESMPQSPQAMKEHREDATAGDVVLKTEPGHPPKLTRTPSQKVPARAAAIFSTYPDKTDECKETFQVISSCIYSSKQIGSTEQAMECDCAEEWGKTATSKILPDGK